MYWFFFMDNYQHGPRTSKTPHPTLLKPIHLTSQMDLPLSIVIAINALSNAILVHFNNRNPVMNKSLRVPLYFLWRIKPSQETLQIMHRLPQKEVNHLYDRCGDLPLLLSIRCYFKRLRSTQSLGVRTRTTYSCLG